jgi:hypothetical protein
MRTLSNLLVFTSTLILANCSCTKDPELKPETVTINGKTFGCRVDGVPFIADKWDYGLSIPPITIEWRARPFFGGRDIYVIAKRENEQIEIWLNHPFTVGNREVKFNTMSYPSLYPPDDYALYRTITSGKEYITNNSLGGHINLISVDSVSGKIHSEFEFTGTDPFSGNKKTVTKGVFKNF